MVYTPFMLRGGCTLALILHTVGDYGFMLQPGVAPWKIVVLIEDRAGP